MRAGAFFALALLAACGDAPVASLEPVVPPRPDPPPTWRMVTSDDGDVRLWVPPDLDGVGVASSVIAQRRGDDAELLTVAAIPPGQLVQPRGEPAVRWANGGGWLSAGQGHVDEAGVRSRDLLLPAGPTVELTSTWTLGDAGPRWTMLHLIRTPNGFGLLQVTGEGSPPDDAPEEVHLMRELVEFAP